MKLYADGFVIYVNPEGEKSTRVAPLALYRIALGEPGLRASLILFTPGVTGEVLLELPIDRDSEPDVAEKTTPQR